MGIYTKVYICERCGNEFTKKNSLWGTSPLDNSVYKKAQERLNELYNHRIDMLSKPIQEPDIDFNFRSGENCHALSLKKE